MKVKVNKQQENGKKIFEKFIRVLMSSKRDINLAVMLSRNMMVRWALIQRVHLLLVGWQHQCQVVHLSPVGWQHQQQSVLPTT